MVGDGKKVQARFYSTRSGNQPVREWLLELTAPERWIIGGDIATAEFGWPVGMPVCKAMGEGLWEIRSNLPGNRIARIFISIHGGELLLLHGFIKKSRQTPKSDLTLAIRRKKEVEHGE